MINIYFIIYYLNLNNIYDIIKTNLNIVNQFLAYYILIQFNIRSLKIRNQFYSPKFQL